MFARVKPESKHNFIVAFGGYRYTKTEWGIVPGNINPAHSELEIKETVTEEQEQAAVSEDKPKAGRPKKQHD